MKVWTIKGMAVSRDIGPECWVRVFTDEDRAKQEFEATKQIEIKNWQDNVEGYDLEEDDDFFELVHDYDNYVKYWLEQIETE